jgi:hypothetical protein
LRKHRVSLSPAGIEAALAPVWDTDTIKVKTDGTSGAAIRIQEFPDTAKPALRLNEPPRAKLRGTLSLA